ncbi:MAG: class I lanthipeptide [Kordia sp.]|uniref:class I lanthipeptide n=1 Tax=Kordia sp. TaxID=1965332 RepID=UPI0038587B08
MKKKRLNYKRLRLRKKTVSSLSTEQLKGGTRGTLSNFADADTNCGALTGTCQTALGCPYTDQCPPTEICIPSISCEPVGIC